MYIKKIEENYSSMSLNKAIALSRELFNKIEANLKTATRESLHFAFENFVILFYPITPFICHEIWEQFGHKTIMADVPWPKYDEKLAEADTITMAVQVNGKLRKTISVTKNTDEATMKSMALETLNITNFKKIIIVPFKVVNIVL